MYSNDKLVNLDIKPKIRNLIYIGFISLIIFGFYYFMSPYQNCVREVEREIEVAINTHHVDSPELKKILGVWIWSRRYVTDYPDDEKRISQPDDPYYNSPLGCPEEGFCEGLYNKQWRCKEKTMGLEKWVFGNVVNPLDR